MVCTINLIQNRLEKSIFSQKIISKKYFGEQPVGSSFIVKTGNKEHPWLAHSPTMTVPMNISRSFNVYHAMLATLYAIKTHNMNVIFPSKKIKTIVCRVR